MNCSQCGHRLAVSERICRRCRFVAELDETLNIEPPRADRKSRLRVMPLNRLRKLRTLPKPPAKATRWPFLFVAGVVPGLGHLLGRRVRHGFAFMLAIAILLTAASYLSGVINQLLFGLTAGVHALSMYTLLPAANRDEFFRRMTLMGAILVFLMLSIYWPLSRAFMWNEQTYIRVNGRMRPLLLGYEIVPVVYLAGLFIFVALVAGLASVALSAMKSERQSR